MRLALLPLLVGACAVEPPPVFDLPFVAVYVDPEADLDVDATLAGAQIWNELGFQVDLYDPMLSRRQCPRNWYVTGDIDCELGAYILTPDDLEPGTLGLAFRELRQIWLRPDLDDPTLVMAHELGHLVLDTGAHLEGGARGVMAASTATAVLEITADDRALACEAIGTCF